MNLSQRMNILGTESAFEVASQVAAIERAGKRVIKFHIGQPDFSTPDNIKSAGISAIKENCTGYTEAHGLRLLREEVCREFKKTRGMECSPEQIIIAPGAKPIIFATAFALLEKGCEAIVPDPGYPIYSSAAAAMGAKVLPMPLTEQNDFSFDHEELKKTVSKKTRLLFLNSPANPTGGVMSRDDLGLIRDLAVDRDFTVISDEVYNRFLYDGSKHESIASLDGMEDRTILLDGFSKTFSMTGWRLGYAAMPIALAKAMSKIAINMYSCPANFTQRAGIEALAGSQESVKKMIGEFDKRRKIMVAGLNAIAGVSCANPKGAFYAFPNVKKILRWRTSNEMQDFLLQNAGVSCLSGSAFGSFGEGYLRFSYATGEQDIREGLERVGKAFAEF